MRASAILSMVGYMALAVVVSVPMQTASAQQAAAQTVAQTTAQTDAQTAVPRLVQFSGVLKDAASRPVSGVTSVTFAVYADQEGGEALWTETQNVQADANGHYSAVLGVATTGGFPVDLFGTGQSRWLGVEIARQPELPRILMASVPYALKSGDAETLGGLPASSYVTTQQLAASNARPTMTIISGGAAATATSENAIRPATVDAAQQPAITEATPAGSGSTDYIPLWTSSSNLGNSLLFQTSGKIGLGTTTPAATFDINGGEILRGAFYEYPQATATASTGQPSHSFQWNASVFNGSTKTAVDYAFGFRAIPHNNDTTTPAASLDLFYGTGGPTGSTSDLGLSISSTGVITFVPGQTFSGTSLDFGYGASQQQGVIYANGKPLLSTYGSPDSVFLGEYSGGGYGENGADQNVGVGYGTLYSLTTGASNSAVGSNALGNDTTGYANTAMGSGAQEGMQIGHDNVAIGAGAIEFSSGSSYNTAVGDLSLSSEFVGSQNVAVGYSAAANNEGSYNTFLGYEADSPAQAINYSTAIGYAAQVAQSNAMALGGVGPYAVNVGIGTPTPHSQLEISGVAGTSYLAPNPVLTITGTGAGTTALDFNSEGISTTGTYNPSVRMAVLDEGGAQGNVLAFYANKAGGGLNNGLQQTFAVDAAGNAYVTGTLSKAGGSFKIDDPIDPAGKYLSHSFVESPDMMNIYNGIVTLDAHGNATVTMPDWFSALNRDFRYTLTAIGSPAPKLFIAEELHDNQFRIAGGKKGQRVSWQITGVRQDAWANAHRIPTEEAKPDAEQGHYLHPELFGAGPDKAVSAASALQPAPASSATAVISAETTKPHATNTLTSPSNGSN